MRANCAARRHSTAPHRRPRREWRAPQKRQALLKTRDPVRCAAPLRGRRPRTRLIICAVPLPLPAQHPDRHRQADRHPERRHSRDALHLKEDLLPERQLLPISPRPELHLLSISRHKDPPCRRVIRQPENPGRQVPQHPVPALPQTPTLQNRAPVRRQAPSQAPSQALPSTLPAPVPCAPPHREAPWCPQKARRSLPKKLPALRCPPPKPKNRQQRQEQPSPHMQPDAAVQHPTRAPAAIQSPAKKRKNPPPATKTQKRARI